MKATNIIGISERAKQELLKLNVGGPRFLRIAIVPGGCSGMTYAASVDTTLTDQDEMIYDDGDLRVVAESGSAIFLDGLRVDYSDDLIKSGFRFISPKSVKSCGCGSSFAM